MKNLKQSRTIFNNNIQEQHHAKQISDDEIKQVDLRKSKIFLTLLTIQHNYDVSS